MEDIESSRLTELLQRYSSNGGEGSTSFKYQPTPSSTRTVSLTESNKPVRAMISAPERTTPNLKASPSAPETMQDSSATSQNSSTSSLHASTPCLLSVQNKPPRFTKHRFTPRQPKKLSCTLIQVKSRFTCNLLSRTL